MAGDLGYRYERGVAGIEACKNKNKARENLPPVIVKRIPTNCKRKVMIPIKIHTITKEEPCGMGFATK
jgi:hypothetical protein